jgi:hypothetical protein
LESFHSADYCEFWLRHVESDLHHLCAFPNQGEDGEKQPSCTIIPQPRHASPTLMPSLSLDFIKALAVKAPARLPTDLYRHLNGLKISRRRSSKRGTKGYGRGVIQFNSIQFIKFIEHIM